MTMWDITTMPLSNLSEKFHIMKDNYILYYIKVGLEVTHYNDFYTFPTLVFFHSMKQIRAEGANCVLNT